MNDILLFWIAVGIIFLIIEMLTTTFYGLAISFAGFIVAGHVWYTDTTNINIIQGLIFLVMSTLASILIPRIFSGKAHNTPQGLDIYLGQQRRVKKVGDIHKVVLDGIAYEVNAKEIQEGDEIILTHREGSVFSGKTL